MSGTGSLGSGDDRAAPHPYRVLGGVVGLRYADGGRQQTALVEDQAEARPGTGPEHAPKAPGEVTGPQLDEAAGLGRVGRCDDHGDEVAGACGADGLLGGFETVGAEECDH
ncbi:hypothetical protein SJ972_15665, partial [Enterococcus faecium]